MNSLIKDELYDIPKIAENERERVRIVWYWTHISFDVQLFANIRFRDNAFPSVEHVWVS